MLAQWRIKSEDIFKAVLVSLKHGPLCGQSISGPWTTFASTELDLPHPDLNENACHHIKSAIVSKFPTVQSA
jgi:hypothetical protein